MIFFWFNDLTLDQKVTIATNLGKVVTRLQLERSEVSFYIFTNGNIERWANFYMV